MIPTHFGIYPDAEAHLAFGLRLLEETSAWLERVMASGPDLSALRREFEAWMAERGRAAGLSADVLAAYEAEGPNAFAATGLERYWRKVRNAPDGM